MALSELAVSTAWAAEFACVCLLLCDESFEEFKQQPSDAAEDESQRRNKTYAFAVLPNFSI